MRFFLFLLLIGGINACTTIKPAAKRSAAKLVSGGISSRLPEFGGTTSSKQDIFYFNRTDSIRSRIYLMRAPNIRGLWSAAEIVSPADSGYRYLDPWLSPDGAQLYLTTDLVDPRVPKGYNLWTTSISKNGWSPLEPLSATINSIHDEIYSSLTREGTLYFSRFIARKSGIYFAQKISGQYEEPVRVMLPIPDSISVSNPAISPDGSYLIFASAQLNGQNNADLYMSRRLGLNTWATPLHLGSAVNTSHAEFAPFISHDGQWLYFTSERPGVVNAYPEGQRRPGDVYRIKMKKIVDSKGQ